MAQKELERFRGRSVAEIVEIRDIESTMWQIYKQEDLAKLRERSSRLLYYLTPKLMLSVAEASESRGVLGVAHLWYWAVAEAGNDKPFLKFLERTNGWSELLARDWELSKASLRRIAKESLSYENLDVTVAAYGRLGDEKGLRTVLRRAMREGKAYVANEAARFLGTPLTQEEHRALIAQLASRDKEGAFKYVQEFKIAAEHAEYLVERILDQDLSFAQIAILAARLEVTLTVLQIEKLLRRSRRIPERLAIISALAVLSKTWEEILPEMLAGLREEYLVEFDLRAADEIGMKIGKPLSVAEVNTALVQIKALSGRRQDGASQVMYGEAVLIKLELENG